MYNQYCKSLGRLNFSEEEFKKLLKIEDAECIENN